MANNNRIGNFLYNIDRAAASLIWGTSQETISSEVGRIARGSQQVGEPVRWGAGTKMAKALARWLNNTPKIWGINHCEKAIIHADALDKADDGAEQ